MKWADRARLAVRTTGELLITLGALLFLYCAYQLFYTNIVAHQAMRDELDELRQRWAHPAATARAAGSRDASAVPAPFDTADAAGTEGEAFAIIHIPRLGADDATPILEGTSLDVLGRGVGHYRDSAMPGQVGNFAVAGHRKTHGEPFRHLDELRAGDLVVVETAATWYTYRVDQGPFIIEPTDLGIVDPVPNRPGATPTERLMTLTTCNPWWASTQRMIVTGHLVGQQPRSAGEPRALHPTVRNFD